MQAAGYRPVEARGTDEKVPAMLTGLVVISGLALLLALAVCIGASLDTEGQRREWRRLAAERRLRRSARYEGCGPTGQYCERCPYRR